MSDRLLVATRKGLFTVDRSGPGEWAVSNTSFLGDPVTMMLDDARDGTLYAALNLGHFGVKLRRSEDRGQNWEEVEAPAFSPEPDGKLDATPAADINLVSSVPRFVYDHRLVVSGVLIALR